jgi:hypothetical protein
MQHCQSKAQNPGFLGICVTRKLERAEENLLMRTISGRIDGEPSRSRFLRAISSLNWSIDEDEIVTELLGSELPETHRRSPLKCLQSNSSSSSRVTYASESQGQAGKAGARQKAQVRETRAIPVCVTAWRGVAQPAAAPRRAEKAARQ